MRERIRPSGDIQRLIGEGIEPSIVPIRQFRNHFDLIRSATAVENFLEEPLDDFLDTHLVQPPEQRFSVFGAQAGTSVGESVMKSLRIKLIDDKHQTGQITDLLIGHVDKDILPPRMLAKFDKQEALQHNFSTIEGSSSYFTTYVRLKLGSRVGGAACGMLVTLVNREKPSEHLPNIGYYIRTASYKGDEMPDFDTWIRTIEAIRQRP